MNTHPALTINGIAYSKDDLMELCSAKLPLLPDDDWEWKFYHFIREWLNEEPHVTVYTSGSTGEPKTLAVEKKKMRDSALLTLEFLELKKNETALLCLSCGHIAGKMMTVRAIEGALNLTAISPASNPLMQVDAEKKIHFAAFVPMQAQEMLRDKKTAEQFAQIEKVILGGAPVSDTLRRQLSKMDNEIYETYGMTETVSHVALKPVSGGSLKKSKEEGNLFTALKNIRFTTDGRNCLVIHAPHLSDAPFITNDIVDLKNERQFQWLGRFDNIINSGGVKIVPETVEEKIRHLFDTSFFIAGIPDGQLGEKVALVIEKSEIENDALLALRKEMETLLGKYETPKEVILVPELERTAEGKIRRKATLEGVDNIE